MLFITKDLNTYSVLLIYYGDYNTNKQGVIGKIADDEV